MTCCDYFGVRGTFIVPSFDEIWPQPGKSAAEKKRKRMGMEYILEAMQHHGLGHLPQAMMNIIVITYI